MFFDCFYSQAEAEVEGEDAGADGGEGDHEEEDQMDGCFNAVSSHN